MTTTKPVHGAWIDDPPALVQTPKFWHDLRELGITTGAIMLESVRDGFDPIAQVDVLGTIGEVARGADCEVVLTDWPQPSRLWMDAMRAQIGEFIKASGAAALEGDGESNWTRGKLHGFATLELAAHTLVALLDDISAEHNVRTEWTTFTEHAENSVHALVAPFVDRVLPQAYSVRNRKDAKGNPIVIEWDGTYGPGGMQRRTLDRAVSIPKRPDGKPFISCGLAAYDQTWPGRKPEDAMRVAYEAALAYDPREVRWWSSKWIIGVQSKNGGPGPANFLRSIR